MCINWVKKSWDTGGYQGREKCRNKVSEVRGSKVHAENFNNSVSPEYKIQGRGVAEQEAKGEGSRESNMEGHLCYLTTL